MEGAPASDNYYISAENELKFDFPAFKQEFGDTITHSAGYLYQRIRSDDVRYNIWEGQSEDGRKWGQYYGNQPFPWEGCADTRTYFVDEIINELVEMKMAALKRARIQATPIAASTTLPEANLHTQVLQYVIKNRIGNEWTREFEPLLQWQDTYGLSAMSVYWRRETDMEEVTVPMSEIMMLASRDQSLADILAKLQGQEGISESDYESLGLILENYYPGVKAKSAINSLLKKGYFTFDREYFRINRPSVRALRILEDIFFPVNTYALQEAKWVARRDILSVAEVMDRAKVEDWDPKFTEQILRTKGNSVISSTYFNTWRVRITNNVFVNDVWDRIEVFYAYTREVDETKKRSTYETVWHPQIEFYGKRELFEYEHGEFPFIEFPRERITRSLLESRGVPQVAGPVQSEVKMQRDSRIDRTSLATLPPLKVPLGRGRNNIQLGPSVQLPVGPTGDYSWLAPPPLDQMSIEIEQLLTNNSKSYFGQYNEAADPNKILLRQQVQIDRFLEGVRLVCNQIYQLCQQYMSDEDVQAVVKQPASIHAGRGVIQGKFDLSVEFDARDLNTEFLEKKLGALSQFVIPFDRSGSVDYNYFMRYAASSVDPTFASQGIKAQDAATQQEISDEKNNWSQIANGIEPPMPPTGLNYGLRLQVAGNLLQSSPSLQQEISSDQYKQKIAQNRMKFLQFQVQQQQNAVTGKVGTTPVQQ